MTALAGTSARPVFDTMLYGNVTGLKYGWARPGEAEALLRGARAAAPPESPDTCLVPAEDHYFFWDEFLRRACGEGTYAELDGLPVPGAAEPEMTFYLGTHLVSWLWDGTVDFPLCISYGRLRRIKRLRRGMVPWILDSRGFSELSQHGRWTISAEEYVADVARYDEEIGGLAWASPQDWMMEDAIIHGGMAGNVRCVGTHLPGEEHQRRTVASFTELTALWPRYSSRPCPFIPVLQGDSPASYLRCYQMYLDAGVLLGEEHPLAGVGSVCRLQATGRIAAVARALAATGLELHWFGLKLTGLERPEIQRDPSSCYAAGGTQSMDSASWSLDARFKPRMPGCTHVHRATGRPSPCNNCRRYAARWRDRVLAAMATGAAARGHVQGELFDTDEMLGAGAP
jgi:hypothetical protein